MDKKKIAFLAVTASVAVVAAGTWAFNASASNGSDAALIKRVEKQFPNTKVTGANCDTGLPLCEVIAGQNVFYVTKDARFAFVGAVLDLEKKRDLTDSRLRELAAVGNAEAKINGQAAAAPAGPQRAPAPAGDARTINVTLPAANGIVHNAGAPIKIKVFSDLNCGYCNRLHSELKTAKDIEVTEYPMAFLSPDSREKGGIALCAKDRSKAVDAIYNSGEVVTSGDCEQAKKAVDANTEFGQRNGITGTPTIVRADGQSHSGWMPLPEVRAWATQGSRS